MNHSETYYQGLARYYTNLSILKRCMATVHVEGKTDRPFWEPMFRRSFPNERFYFISYSKSINGKETSGCWQCLKFRKHLNKRFFICIDSDYRLLMQEKDIDIKHLIFQTYTYSFENHLCFSATLNRVCKIVTGFENTVFDFEIFFKRFSSIIYEFFVWHLALQRRRLEGLSKSEFMQIISLRGMPFDINRQSKTLLAILNRRVIRHVRLFEANFPDMDIEREKAHFATIGLREDNAYLYIRGHNLYSLVVAIGNQVCNWILELEKIKYKGNRKRIIALYDNKKDLRYVLNSNIPKETYSEMQKISGDMEEFKSLCLNKHK